MKMITKDLNTIKKNGLEALRNELGPVGMVKFIQLFDSGKGDYTKEREHNLKDFSRDELENWIGNRNH